MPSNLTLRLIISSFVTINVANAQPVKHVVSQTAGNVDTIVKVDPPLLGFYSKCLNSDGIPIRSASVVDDEALIIASAKIRLMLKYMPAARKNLIMNGAELHIIGRDQQTSDLPEFRDKKGVTYMDNGVLTDIDKRTRGMGGIYASCGEENLLRLPTDRYRGGSDICIHEFAHTVRNFGLDTTVRKKIEAQYRRSTAKGLWKDAYAGSNSDEYWAELSMWYFGFHGEFLKNTKNLPTPGPAGLSSYDEGGYKLLDSIYKGLIQPEVIKRKTSLVVAKGERSLPSTEKAVLTVINNRPGTLKLYWIDWDGNPKLYATVPTRSRYAQPTFTGHVWMLKDEAGNELVYLRVNDVACELKIGN